MWGFGVVLAVIASFCGTAGKQLFRFAELKRLEGVALEDDDVEQSQRKIRQGKVAKALGLFIIAICGPLLDIASYGFAAQSMIAPFAGTDIVVNMLLAPFTLGESWTRTRFGGALIVASGTVMTAFFGPQEDQEYTRAYVEEVVFSWRVFGYMLVLSTFVVGNIIFHSRRPHGETWRGLSLGITAGTLAGNMFCVKATIELIKAAAREGIEVWAHWVPWMCLAGAIVFALSNLRFLEQGMREQEALLMGTLFEGSLVLAGCTSGIVVLQEVEHRTGREISLYLVSVAVIFSGICILWFGELRRKALSQNEIIPSSNGAKDGSTTVPSTLGNPGSQDLPKEVPEDGTTNVCTLEQKAPPKEVQDEVVEIENECAREQKQPGDCNASAS